MDVAETEPAPPSRSQVDRAGDVLRSKAIEVRSTSTEGDRVKAEIAFTAEGESDAANELDSVVQAVGKVVAFRLGHAMPMEIAHIALANATSDDGSAVSSRHKRLQAIVDKLHRFPNMRLSQMDDIAGCRVVVKNLAQIERLRYALGEAMDVVRVNDYVVKPKPIGYRAVHVILSLPETNLFMQEQSQSALVEVQIRTPLQNEWADQIEAATGTTGLDLKGGDPAELPSDLVEYVRVAADIRALADRGEPADNELEGRLAELREVVRPHFKAR